MRIGYRHEWEESGFCVLKGYSAMTKAIALPHHVAVLYKDRSEMPSIQS